MGAILWCAEHIWTWSSPPLAPRKEGGSSSLWYLLAYVEHSSFVGADPAELLSLVHPRQPSCGNEREWSSLGGQLGLSYTALCAWRDTKPQLLAFMLNCSAGQHQSCQCTPAPQENAPAPLASAQGSTCFPQTHLHDINSRENCPCTYPLHGWEEFPAELWSRARYRCHLSLVVPLPLTCSGRGCVGWVLPFEPGGSYWSTTALHGWIWASATSLTGASIQQDEAPKIFSAP